MIPIPVTGWQPRPHTPGYPAVEHLQTFQWPLTPPEHLAMLELWPAEGEPVFTWSRRVEDGYVQLTGISSYFVDYDIAITVYWQGEIADGMLTAIRPSSARIRIYGIYYRPRSEALTMARSLARKLMRVLNLGPDAVHIQLLQRTPFGDQWIDLD